MTENSVRESKTNEYEDYDILEDLTRGEIARILKVALKENPDKIKLMKCLKYTDEKDKKMADEEVNMLKLAESQHTIRYIESFLHQSDLCIIMEYEGGNLRETIEKLKILPVKERKEVFVSYSIYNSILNNIFLKICYSAFFHILLALAHLHSLKIIHRNLKPENIFLDRDGNVKIGGFGLVEKMTSQQLDLTSNKLDYQAPEVHKSNKISELSDIWSLAVIIIECLTCVHQFAGKNLKETIANTKRGKFAPFPDYIKGELKDILVSMLNTNPVKRPSAMDLLDSELMQLIQRIETEKKEREQVIKEKELIIKEKELIIQELEQQLKNKDSQIKENKEDIEENNNEIKEEKEYIKEKVLSFKNNDEFEENNENNAEKINDEQEEQNEEQNVPLQELEIIAAELKTPPVGNEDEINEIIQQQKALLSQITSELKYNDDTEIRKGYLNAGVAGALIEIINSQQLDKITLVHMECLISLLQSKKEIIQMFDKNQLLQGLIRLLDHTDTEIRNDAFGCIFMIALFGLDESHFDLPNEYFDTIQQYGGIDKIIAMYRNQENEDDQKTGVLLCICFIYHARVINDKELLHEVNEYIKFLLSSNDERIVGIASQALGCLVQNSENLSEIMKGVQLDQIAIDLQIPLTDNEEEKEKIKKKQENHCNFLFAILFYNNDAELRMKFFNSRIIDALLNIFATRDLYSISEPYIRAFYAFTSSINLELNNQLVLKKPFNPLLRLFDYKTVDFAILAILSIIQAEAQQVNIDSLNPYYEMFNESVGIEKIFELFHNQYDLTTNNFEPYDIFLNLHEQERNYLRTEGVNDRIAVLIGNLFRAQEICDAEIKSEVIEVLKANINKTEDWIRIESGKALKFLALNQVNREEIEKDDFIILE